jgi:hypothetical protein
VDLRRALAMAEAELELARGQTRQARERLSALGALLDRSGMALAELERRLLLLRVDAADGQPTVRAAAVALERDAQARGAGLVAGRARALAR